MTCKNRPQAVAAAKKALKLMKCRCWKIVVCENLGGHWNLASGPVSIHPSFKRFWAMVSDDPKDASFGSGLWGGGETVLYTDPNAAAAAEVRKIHKVINKIEKARHAALQAIGQG